MLNPANVAIRCVDLQQEIRRIANVTLRQDFANPDDRRYWEDRLTRLSGELRALESIQGEAG